MPQMEATLTWALPVNAETLLAHLDAYAELLPALNTLRLCNRFGGSTCLLTKLPIELLQLVEGHLARPIQDQKLEQWEKNSSCFTGNCGLLQHVDRDRLLSVYNECNIYGRFASEPDDLLLESTLYDLDMDLDDEEQHEDQVDEWPEMVAECFRRHRALFKAHFGLDTWHSLTRAAEEFNDRPEGITTTWLTLPSTTSSIRKLRRIYPTYENDQPCNTGCDLPVTIGTFPTLKSLRRFPRAMKALHLEIFDHESQEERPGSSLTLGSLEDVANGATEAENKTTPVTYPRLTLLMRAADRSQRR